METFKRYVLDIYLPKSRLNKVVQAFPLPVVGVEFLTILTSITLLGCFYLWKGQALTELYPQIEFSKISRQVIQSSEDGELMEDQPPYIQNNLRKHKYSFSYTSLGFFLENLSFLENEDAAKVEHKLLMSLPGHVRKRAKKFIRATLLLAEKHQVDPIWVLSVMWTESHFIWTAKSHKGAMGLMQLMPETKTFIYNMHKRHGNELAVENIFFNIQDYFNHEILPQNRDFYVKKLINIELGIIYLKHLLKSFNYSHKLATVAYNMGPGWTKKRLRDNLPVGVDNLYLDKVRKAYKLITREI